MMEEDDSRQYARRFSHQVNEAPVGDVERRWQELHCRGGSRPLPSIFKRIRREIAEVVSASDTVIRTGTQCRKKFNDLSRVIRAKKSHNRHEQVRTSGSPPQTLPLTDIEKRVAGLIGVSNRATATGGGADPPLGN